MSCIEVPTPILRTLIPSWTAGLRKRTGRAHGVATTGIRGWGWASARGLRRRLRCLANEASCDLVGRALGMPSASAVAVQIAPGAG
jgi:hypothetical protein